MARRFVLLAVSWSLLACTGGFRVHNTSCDADFTEWARDDLVFLAAETERDGSFDVDPEGELKSRVFGSFDFESGGFSIVTSYSPLHYTLSEEVQGTGSVEENGDIDVTYTSTREYVDDTTDVNEWRVVRTGCSETGRITGEAFTNEYVATYASDAVSYVGSFDDDGTVVDYEDVLRNDWTRTTEEVWVVESGSYERVIEEDVASGTGTYEFVTGFTDGEGSRVGSVGWDLAGSWWVDWHTEFASGTEYDVEYEVDFFGDGEGTKDAIDPDGETYRCELVFEDGDCTQDCDPGYPDGDCAL